MERQRVLRERVIGAEPPDARQLIVGYRRDTLGKVIFTVGHRRCGSRGSRRLVANQARHAVFHNKCMSVTQGPIRQRVFLKIRDHTINCLGL